MRKILRGFSLSVMLFLAFRSVSLGQAGILDPNDPIVVYNPAAPPATPANGTMAKWVKTNRLGWNSSSYKSYFYKNLAFRLKFPKSYVHGVSDGKKYPVYIFFHGIGERGSIYDNEYQLYHGGELHRNAVDNNNFDGFLLYAQSANTGGDWSPWHFSVIKEIVENYLVPQVKADINRIIVDGLSGGGSATWQFARTYPQMVAAVLPISAPVNVQTTNASIPNLKFTPIWTFQGGLDDGPTPFTTENVVNAYKNAGSDMTYTLFPKEGHGCWYSAWGQANYFPYLRKANKLNPWPLNGRTEYCPGETISQVIGVTPGFTSYKWRKNGVEIPGATSNQITATSLGSYDCQIQRGSVWSEWSPVPVVLVLKAATVPPPISTVGLVSNAIPSLDGATGVTLQVTGTYASYSWQRVGNPAVLGTGATYTATSAGDYTVKVMEQYGCSSDFSPSFHVVNANATPRPEAATGLAATALSKTSIRVDWIDNATSETNYEIFRGTAAGGPYKLLTVVPANTVTYTDADLNADTRYYYQVRAINTASASPASNEANALTERDNNPPTAPGALTVTGTGRTSVSLSWIASTDDVEVSKYEVYVNGVMMYTTTSTTFTVYNLIHNDTYNFVIKAKDPTGNVSAPSNQATAQPRMTGLNYKYYTYTGTWNNLPDFNTLTPVTTGEMPQLAITPRTQNDNFAFLWEGYINITVAGNYYFRTSSDDGSKLYLGPLNGTSPAYGFGNTAIVNNDGLHGTQAITSVAQNLQVGVYPIAMTFYEQGGGEAMDVTWSVPGNSAFVAIPASAYIEPAIPEGTAPIAPTGVVANALTNKTIKIDWAENSGDETGFEIWRSTNPTTGFLVTGQVGANVITYTDTALLAATTYYYKVRAVNQFGESAFSSQIGTGAEGLWKLDNNYNDISGGGRTLVQTSNPTFDAADKQQGTHSLVLNGTSQYVSPPTTGSFMQTAYTQKSILMWIKSSSNTGNRFVYEFGGSDDGLAVRLDANRLYAGIAGNNTRVSISAPYTSTGWNHVAVVYNVNSLRLYVNGVEVASNTALGFNTTTTTSGAHRVGYADGGTTGNVFQISSPARFSGKMDDLGIYNRALSPAEIDVLRSGAALPQSVATTLSAPPAPAAPANLIATGVSPKKVEVTWNDVPDETSYEVFRSAVNNSNYQLAATLPNNVLFYNDTAVVANTVYYYQVRAKNDGGYSPFSVADSAITGNNPPVIAAIENQQMRYGTTFSVPVSASDADPETLTITYSGIPTGFSSFVPTGNGTGNLVFNPTVSDQGTYTITVTAADATSSVSTQFNLLINDNFPPVIGAVTNVTVNEAQSAQLVINATDANAADALTWSFENLPSFATPTINGASVTFAIAPGYADHGVYNVTAKITDGNSGTDTKEFTITVNNVDPTYKVLVNFTSGTYLAPAPWNNTNKSPAVNDVFGNLKNDKGETTAISLKLLNVWQGINNVGANTGNNSGIYPDNVLRSSYYTNTTVQNVEVAGLSTGSKYKFTFLGSRYNPTGNVTANYTIAGTTVTLDATNNIANTVSIANVSPDANGKITFQVSKASGATFAYINSVIIESTYDDGSAPAKPRNVTGVFQDGKAHLTWIDAAFNETAYQVYRSEVRNGTYTLLNPAGNNPNIELYDDATVTGNKTYFYAVRTINANGNSPFSDTVSVTTDNTNPILTAITDQQVGTGEIKNINVTATGEPGETLTLSLTGAPSFVTLTDNGNGTGVLKIEPGTTTGIFDNVTVTATDNGGASSFTKFKITVKDANLTYTYVNFNQTFPETGWNNFNSAPSAGTTLTNLKDKNNVATGVNIALTDSWTGVSTGGSLTGNNSGVYPDNVLRSTYYDANARRITLTGLSQDKRYNLVFVASRASGTSLITRYAAGGKTADLNVDNNTTGSVKLENLAPTASGQLEITVSRVGSSTYGYIGGLEIQSYPFEAVPLPPVNVTATGLTVDKIKIDWVAAGSVGTGYEIWKSSSLNGTYTKLADAPFSSSTFTNSGLTGGTVVYYKIRTVVSPGVFTEFSNVASASTVAYLVNVNINDDPANAELNGWNNTNTLLNEGFVLPNLKNSLNQNTGINFNIIENFSGYNSAIGLSTGNNSGVVPDKVMSNFYFNDFADTARFSFSGLNQANKYNLIFYSGSSYSAANNTVWKVGNQTVSLGSYNNYTNTVKISNVSPDEDGNILIIMYASVGYAIMNSVQLEAIPLTTPPVGGLTARGTGSNAKPQVIHKAQVVDEETVNYSVFPNPFVNDVTLQMELKKNVQKFSVVLYDLSGRLIYRKEFSNATRGPWRQALGLNGRVSTRGTYILQIQGVNEQPIVTKLVRF
ncbi:MAG: T9SS type A sorting domain-containing protein [Chitinophagaceae bacterium]|nr:MAG: T9SS type A sorting domain-containing protein [Chitinophagaceae bacterium]